MAPGVAMAGAKYASPEKGEGATLPGKPQDAWNSTEAGRAPGTTPTHKRRNSVVDLLDELATGDEDGAITRAGFDKLCEQMGVNMNSLERRRAFASLDKLDGKDDGRSQYSYVRPRPLSLAPARSAQLVTLGAVQVHAWVKKKRQSQLRAARQLARKLFDMADEDRSGFLNKDEVIQVELGLKHRCPEIKLTPPFDADDDFAAMDADGRGLVSWSEFEAWWMSRSGDDEPSCPVLPEAMVAKMDETCEEGLARWDFLRERLRVLVSMQRLWGQIGELYKGSSDSLYAKDVLPRFVRGPDSKATRYWDLAQIVFICWVATVVPYRICFDIQVPIGSASFFIDAAIDLFFIIGTEPSFVKTSRNLTLTS